MLTGRIDFKLRDCNVLTLGNVERGVLLVINRIFSHSFTYFLNARINLCSNRPCPFQKVN